MSFSDTLVLIKKTTFIEKRKNRHVKSMNNKKDIRQVCFDQVKDNNDINYIDEGIAIHTDIRELPIEEGSMQIDMVTIVTCSKGKLQIELNTFPHILRHNEILVCLPNDIIDNWMMSLDFEGSILCLSQSKILEQISENDLWQKAFQLAENPIIQVSEDSLEMSKLYGAMLMQKIKMKHTLFHREIIISIVKAALYELLSNVDNNNLITNGKGLMKQRDILFKRFIRLLAQTRVKPRDISWYANQLCVTPKYLSTVCKQASGKTALGWINEYVSLDIRFWLKNSNKTIKEVAHLLKFPNISFFGKYCRTHFGISPTEYRKQLRRQTDKSL